MPTILHISDLHRTAEPRLDNNELLAAIASDALRWNREGIPKPDLLVISGDLIQGVDIGSPDPDSEIADQYNEVSDFLKKLATEFVDSNRSRVIIVPGNHDVHWGRAQSAMIPLSNCPTGVAKKAFEANSKQRWDWTHQRAFEINNEGLYYSRFDHFHQFRTNFYAGVEPNPLPTDDNDLVFIEYPTLGIVIAGFSSWHGNDCFCHVGEIDSTSLALSRQLLSCSKAPVAVAVWHHSIVGGPRIQDYMDQRVIHRLIDFGFRVGLHGHQHFPGAAPFELRLPNLTSMTVIGAGSLAVGDRELPMGERRQFNLIAIDPNSRSVTVHVRSMSSGGVFSGSHRDDFGGNTFLKLSLPSSDLELNEATPTKLIDEAMEAVAIGLYEKALEQLSRIGTSHSHEKRQIEIQALDGLGQYEKLISLIDPPLSVDETVRVVALLLKMDRIEEAIERLEAASKIIDRSLYENLSEKIVAKKAAL